jgi:crotonobetainyl-CoA:carnitine CoA-transferase CaiB-like acyl-CoA transferase
MWLVSEDVARAANAPAPGWGTFASRNVYRCADGRQVTVAASEPRTWATLCEGLAVPELAAHRLGLDDEAPVTWIADPGLAGGVGPVHEPADLLDDPQVTERGSVIRLDGSDVRVLASPIRLDGGDGAASSAARTAPPDLGADTDEVLAAAGLAADEIAALRADGVVP